MALRLYNIQLQKKKHGPKDYNPYPNHKYFVRFKINPFLDAKWGGRLWRKLITKITKYYQYIRDIPYLESEYAKYSKWYKQDLSEDRDKEYFWKVKALKEILINRLRDFGIDKGLNSRHHQHVRIPN